MRPLSDRPVHGPVLQRWLNVSDLGDNLYIVGSRPVLVNWGLLPTEIAA